MALSNGNVARVFRALFAVALVAAVVFALAPRLDDSLGPIWIDYRHVFVFAVLAALAAFGWPGAPLTTIGERLSFLGALIELAQSIPALHRDCDWKDWVADTLAIVAVLALFALSGLRDKGTGQTA